MPIVYTKIYYSMKIFLKCTQCNEYNSHAFLPNNNGIYKILCSSGHNETKFVTNPIHEILFETGINALADGYLREAISSYSASLERFQEHVIKSILVDSEITSELYEKSWKMVSAQSERQIGAFIFLYLEKFREIPDVLGNKQKELRNNVIHKGIYPTEAQVDDFGYHVFSIINKCKDKITKSLPEAELFLTSERQKDYLSTPDAESKYEDISGVFSAADLYLKIAREESKNLNEFYKNYVSLFKERSKNRDKRIMAFHTNRR